MDFWHVTIEYCPKCRWMIRAAWIAQELLSSFETELDEVALRPARVNGVFDIRLNEVLVWSRKVEGRFPDIVELKQKIRDVIAPDKSLGHADRKSQADT